MYTDKKHDKCVNKMKSKNFLFKAIRKIKSLFRKPAKYNGVKNILIFGGVRTGKTTLAYKCHQQLGYSVLDSDLIVNAFDKVFPDIGIQNGAEDLKDKFKPFLYKILDGLTSDMDSNITVFPISQTSLDILKSYNHIDYFLVVVLGFSSITPEELLDNLNKNEKITDWTVSWDNKRKLGLCEYIIKQSKTYEKKCKQYGFYYFDMSKNLPLVQDEIVEFIKEKNKSST